MTELEQAIERLYTTFSRYPRPAKIECCPCGCTKPDATAHLVAVPLRELRFSELEDYCFSGLTTQGTDDDFRYLLPRLFQGIAFENCLCNPEILFGKLRYAKWTGWSHDEVASIKEYLRALWEQGLNSFPLFDHMPAFAEIETLLASIAATREALGGYLRTWSQTAARAADEHLVQFATMWGADFSDGRTFDDAFWEDCKPQAEELRNWLIQPDTIQRVVDCSHLLRKDGFEHLFLPALEVLQIESAVNQS